MKRRTNIDKNLDRAWEKFTSYRKAGDPERDAFRGVLLDFMTSVRDQFSLWCVLQDGGAPKELKAERDSLYLENRRLKRRARKLLKGDHDALYFMGLAPEPKSPPEEA